MNSMKVLFITTSHNKLGDTGGRTGLWLEDLAAPYYVFKDAGAEITIASPNGGPVPLDPKSQSIIVVTRSAKNFLKDETAMSFLSRSILLQDAKAEAFDVAFVSGGHGALWDLAGNKTLTALLEDLNNHGKPIGAVGHGVAGLLAVQEESGELLIKGKRVTSFSNNEEKSTGLTAVVPFLLEDALVSQGALYTSTTNYISYVVADGSIITGQNPASAEEVAKRIVAWHSVMNRQSLVVNREKV
jgi:putative intracellular protease/amidase